MTLKERRKELNLTQKQVAETLYIDQRTYGAYERGDLYIPVTAIPQLAETLQLSIKDTVMLAIKALEQ